MSSVNAVPQAKNAQSSARDQDHGIETMNNWYYRPDSMTITSNFAITHIGVWSVHGLDPTVVVAIYGQPTTP